MNISCYSFADSPLKLIKPVVKRSLNRTFSIQYNSYLHWTGMGPEKYLSFI